MQIDWDQPRWVTVKNHDVKVMYGKEIAIGGWVLDVHDESKMTMFP